MVQPPSQSASEPTQEAAQLAIVYVKERQYAEALRYFQKATAFTPEALSYYGLALAMRRQRLEDAVEFCRQAIDRDPIRAEFYYNLGQVCLARGNKQLAVRTFTQGLRVEPRHAEMGAALQRLGVRKRPIIDGIARTNPINRCLGWMRHRLKIAG
jgi:tetratricopeptide (TPR) repeat protein